MYLGKTLAVAATVYFAVHLVSGAWTCYNEFCPGDNTSDWVYELTDDDGKKYIVENGKKIPIEQYREIK